MSGKNIINLFVRLYVVFTSVDEKTGTKFDYSKKVFDIRVPETFTSAVAVEEALRLLSGDENYVNVSLERGAGNLEAFIDATEKARKASRSPVTEAGLEALKKDLCQLRKYVAKVPDARIESFHVTAYPRS